MGSDIWLSGRAGEGRSSAGHLGAKRQISDRLANLRLPPRNVGDPDFGISGFRQEPICEGATFRRRVFRCCREPLWGGFRRKTGPEIWGPGRGTRGRRIRGDLTTDRPILAEPADLRPSREFRGIREFGLRGIGGNVTGGSGNSRRRVFRRRMRPAKSGFRPNTSSEIRGPGRSGRSRRFGGDLLASRPISGRSPY